MSYINSEQLVWFKNWQPDEKTNHEICEKLYGRRFEFYNLTLNVTKVEKGVVINIHEPEEFFELSNILKQPITISFTEYTVENKILPQIIKTKLIIV